MAAEMEVRILHTSTLNCLNSEAQWEAISCFLLKFDWENKIYLRNQ